MFDIQYSYLVIKLLNDINCQLPATNIIMFTLTFVQFVLGKKFELVMGYLAEKIFQKLHVDKKKNLNYWHRQYITVQTHTSVTDTT